MKRPSLGMAPIKTEVSVEAYSEIMRLEKTIERLREALREIMILSDKRSSHPMSQEADYFRIARAALEGKE